MHRSGSRWNLETFTPPTRYIVETLNYGKEVAQDGTSAPCHCLAEPWCTLPERSRHPAASSFQVDRTKHFYKMASRPSKWRILAVFGGLDLDAVGENKEPTCGAMHEFTDLAGSSAEVCVSFVYYLVYMPELYMVQWWKQSPDLPLSFSSSNSQQRRTTNCLCDSIAIPCLCLVP